MYNGTCPRFRRLLAGLIDWTVVGGIGTALIITLAVFCQENSSAYSTLCALVLLLCMAVFVCRDLLGKGCSPGKRTLGLVILDAKGEKVPTAKQLILKNLFLPLLAIDGLILLATGQSIGERVAKVLVIPEKATAVIRESIATGRPVQDEDDAKLGKRISILLIALLLFLLFIFIQAWQYM